MNFLFDQLNLPKTLESPRYVELCQELSLTSPPHDQWKGAVLFLFNEDELILIKRSELVKTHKGQWAFFGGHRDHVQESPEMVALREFEEESHLSQDEVEFLGLLPPTFTRSSFSIIPVLGRIRLGQNELKEKMKTNGEWDLAVSIPFKHFYQFDSWVYGQSQGLGSVNPIYFLYFPLQLKNLEVLSADSYELGNKDYLLWGATARMIWNFLRISHKYLP